MKAAVIVFPGSNSDHDAFYTLNGVLGQPTEYVWHKDRRDLKDFDLVVLPGGFSYGDYLRTGAIARFAPVMQDVVEFAKFGGTVFGICNGFQILTECGLLPGALLRNRHLKFVGKKVAIRVENTDTRFTNTCAMHEVLINPIAHGDGNYFADAGTIGKLEDSGRVLFRYCTESGEITDEANPNGSINNIAGILNDKGNVAGMMPHPERCSDPLLGANDGIKIFHSLLESIAVES